MTRVPRLEGARVADDQQGKKPKKKKQQPQLWKPKGELPKRTKRAAAKYEERTGRNPHQGKGR